MKQLRAEMLQLGRKAAPRAQALADELHRLKTDPTLHPDVRETLRKVAWQNFGTEVTTEFNVRLGQLQREYNQLLAETTAGHVQPGGQLEEQRRQAAWSRLQADLDALPKGSMKFVAADRLLQEAQRVGDTATIEAARRELPRYLSRAGEMLPEPMAVWLDIQSGVPDVADARLIDMSDQADVSASVIAVKQLANMASNRELTGAIGYPSGVEGERVRTIDTHDPRLAGQ